MDILHSVAEMHRFADRVHHSGRTIGFVPTMGFLHEGHVSLMHIARQHADVLVVSIFVNPTQFGPGEDFESYPRDFERDRRMVAAAGADCLYYPDANEMYPDGYQTMVCVRDVTRNLCGLSRPTHFEGVATVVTKLFNAVKPQCAVFGQKDFQQLVVIKRMVKDLNMDIDIIGAPIVREPDGIAMSSRNKYLGPAERQAARCLSRALDAVRARVQAGEHAAQALISLATDIISAEPLGRIDYIRVCDVETLRDVELLENDAVMAVAVFFEKARLIDNAVLHVNGQQS
ncbi:MAG: pantoate--beta-alanine ligase [Deltaproteobacteria bacterium]|nr:pantoate--beta-alanine ligase [Deltaproteobacteria bacterium]